METWLQSIAGSVDLGMAARFKARVEVRLKPGLLDPEGETVKNTLNDLGYSVVDVRICKVYEVVLNAESINDARNVSEEICRRLLANPVKDDYRVEVYPYV